MRGSDPDAAVYWVARMLEAGEDPRFIARRIAILASEDIGNADPQAISVAAAAFDIVEKIGMPEAQLTLGAGRDLHGHRPQDRNARRWRSGRRWQTCSEGRTLPVPKHLSDTHYKGSERLGHGKGYKYAHDFEGGLRASRITWAWIRPTTRPTDRGYEAEIAERIGGFGSGPTTRRPTSRRDQGSDQVTSLTKTCDSNR